MTTTVEQIQDQLRALYGPNHYYTTNYSKEEAGYIGNIPKWLGEYLTPLGSGPQRTGKVLDIGPGYGTLASYSAKLIGAWVVTCDRIPLLSWEVCKEMQLQRLLVDVEREGVPQMGKGWDAVILTEVLEHFNFHPRDTLYDIQQKMNPGGRLYLSTPDSDSWGRCNHYTSLKDIPHFDRQKMSYDKPAWQNDHIWQYSGDELAETIRNAGFLVRNWEQSTSKGGKHFNIEAIRP